MITVIVAAKDSEKWIKKTIDSLQNQTYKEWECIVSINGSTDSTDKIVLAINDSRFKAIFSEIPNKSLAVNRAIIESKSDLICILDADDLWHPNKLEHQIKEFHERNLDVLGTQMIYIDENDAFMQNAPFLPIDHNACISWLKNKNNSIANSSVMYRKLLHDRVGYYDPEKFAVEDYDVWMRSMRMGMKFGNMSDQYLFHRLHKNSNFNSTNRQQICKHLVDEINSFHENLKFI